MKRLSAILLILAMMVTVVIAPNVVAAVETKNEPTQMYAFFGNANNIEGYWGGFMSDAPAQITQLSEIMLDTFTAEKVGDTIYGYTRNTNKFYTVDFNTWECTVTDISDYPYDIRDMAYDYTTNTMYAVGIDTNGYRSLLIVDLVRTRLFMVGEIQAIQPILNFAIDDRGNAYGISRCVNANEGGAELWSINLETAEATSIGRTGLLSDGVNAMTFDHNTGTVYWVQKYVPYGSEEMGISTLYSVDIETANVTNLGIVSATENVRALFTDNDITVPPFTIPIFTVEFVDSVDGSLIGSLTDEAGAPLNEEDFPAPPNHDGLEFVGWQYEGTTFQANMTVTALYRDPNAAFATIVFEVGDVWGDETGYQMLLDADADTFGTIIPESGPFTIEGNDAPKGLYDNFEYLIPEDADGVLETENIVINDTVTITVPAGTYDWCITNPIPGDSLWIAGDRGNVNGRQDNYVFSGGCTYHFKVYFDGHDEAVDVEVSYNGSSVQTWDFESQADFDEWTTIDADGDGYCWRWMEDWTPYHGTGAANSQSYIDGDGALNADNWLISPEFVAGDTASFWMIGVDMGYCEEPIGVYLIVDGVTSPELAYHVATGEYVMQTVDISEYAGQRVQLAFRHYNTMEMYEVNIDYVTVALGEEATEPIAGDADGDGELTTMDALAVLRHALQLAALPDEVIALCDMNGDGETNASDALIILRTAV